MGVMIASGFARQVSCKSYFAVMHVVQSQISFLEVHKSPENLDILDFTAHNQNPNAVLRNVCRCN